MALQVAEKSEARHRQVFQIVEAVAGFGSTQNLMALSNGAVVADSSFYSTATLGVSLGGTYFAGASGYDSDFVASILQADASAPEATFNNVVDMLDWLNRE